MERNELIHHLGILKRYLINFDAEFFTKAVNKSAFVKVLDETVDLLKSNRTLIENQARAILDLGDRLKEQKLVMCRDCIWFHKPDEGTGRPCKCNYHGGVTKEDRYCWWGEKDA